MVVPADERCIFFLDDRALADLPQRAKTFDLEPEVVAEGPQLDQLEDHFRIDAQIQLDLDANRDVLYLLLCDVGQPLPAMAFTTSCNRIGVGLGIHTVCSARVIPRVSADRLANDHHGRVLDQVGRLLIGRC